MLFTVFFSMMLQQVTQHLYARMAFTFVFVQMVQPKTFASPHKNQGDIDQGAIVRWWCCLCWPYWVGHADNSILLRRSCSALRALSKSEKDWSSPSARATRRVPSTKHLQRAIWTESNPPIQLFRMHSDIWFPNIQRSGQLASQGKQRLRRLYKRVSNNRNLKKDTKINVYKAWFRHRYWGP